jgi:hypothetical protein
MSCRARTRELPNHYPFVVEQSYISEVTVKWRQPALDLFEAVDQILNNHVQKIIAQHFRHFGRGGLQHLV